MPLPAALVLIVIAAAAGWIACHVYLRSQALTDPAQRVLNRRERALAAYALNHLAEDAEKENEALKDAGFRILDPVSTDKELRRLAEELSGDR